MAKKRKKNKQSAASPAKLSAVLSSETSTMSSEFGGGPYHHSPRKVDNTGVSIYERQIYSAKALETYRRLNGIASSDAQPSGRASGVQRLRKAKIPVALAPSRKATLPLVRPENPIPLPPILLAACEEFRTTMGNMGDVAEQAINDWERLGSLSEKCKRRLRGWCCATDKKAALMARNILSLAEGNAAVHKRGDK